MTKRAKPHTRRLRRMTGPGDDLPGNLGLSRASHMNWGSGVDRGAYRTRPEQDLAPDVAEPDPDE